MSNIADRLAAFKARFAKLGRPGGGLGGGGGYEDVSALEAPLVGGGGSDGFAQGGGGGGGLGAGAYSYGAGAGPPGSALYRPTAEAAAAEPAAPATVHLPSQEEDLAELTALAREAAELLWEVAATGASTDGGPGAGPELAAKADALRAQLRGLIGDAMGGEGGSVSEAALAAGLGAFEMVEAALVEYGLGDAPAPADAPADAPAAAPAPAPAPPAAAPANPFAAPGPFAPPAVPAPAPAAPGASRPADEAPLISFD